MQITLKIQGWTKVEDLEPRVVKACLAKGYIEIALRKPMRYMVDPDDGIEPSKVAEYVISLDAVSAKPPIFEYFG